MNEKIKKAKEQLDFLKSGTHSETFFENHEYDIECALDNIEKALNDFDKYHESQQDLIKGKDEYIAKLCCDRAELKEQLKQVEDFKYHYDRYKKELANNLEVINCMQEEETTNRNLIDSLEDRNDRLVERLEKSKAERKALKIIVNKLVHINSIMFSDDAKEYNRYAKFNGWVEVTQDEFNLVKKVVDRYGKKED